MLYSSSISVVLQTYRPERDALLELLAGLSANDWTQPTECPAYPVKGIATHVLGDDLSLLSRQRDDAVQGLVYMAEELPGADFRTLLDAFNDKWVATARFMSPVLLIELLRLTGEGPRRTTSPSIPIRSVSPWVCSGRAGTRTPRSGKRLPGSTSNAGSTIRRSAGDSVWGHWRTASSCAV